MYIQGGTLVTSITSDLTSSITSAVSVSTLVGEEASLLPGEESATLSGASTPVPSSSNGSATLSPDQHKVTYNIYKKLHYTFNNLT